MAPRSPNLQPGRPAAAPPETPSPRGAGPATLGDRLRRLVFGAPRDVRDPRTHHGISLVALLAWVGLGADGLSSSAYGPDEAFRALGHHSYLAVVLALATGLTVLVISVAYGQIIKRFPFGGGGYVVATELLGPRVGVVSGAALLVDYVLTISVSVASSGDAIWSFLSPGSSPWKLPAEAAAIALLVVLNLRGVKESVSILAPIFGLFLVTHVILIVGGVGSHVTEVPRVAGEVSQGLRAGVAEVGAVGLFAVFLRAYSMGAGTYTGIEAVSNGIQIMREPKVATARQTMTYMAASLAVTAAGILVCYLLFSAAPEPGKTMNAVLLERFAGGFRPGGVAIGQGFVIVTLLAEAALLVVAAQAGFIDGPRVMANMATDSWLPHRFAQLSDRLTTQNGVLLMGAASLATLYYTRGDITRLVTMYAINVFVTFSLSQLAMLRYWRRTRTAGRRRGLAIHGLAFALCAAILAGTIYEKGGQGGWITVAVTGLVIGLCFLVRRHYRAVQASLKRLDAILEVLPPVPGGPRPAMDPRAPTAVLLVGGYGGLGVHALLTVQRTFPGYFRNFVFVSVGVVDSAAMKGIEEVDRVRERTQAALERYVELGHRLKLAADYRMDLGTEAVEVGERLCAAIAQDFPRAVFFAGKLVFQKERWFQRLLHNETAYQLQRRLQFRGLSAMVMPVRVLAEAA
jgi:amino acid transporter